MDSQRNRVFRLLDRIEIKTGKMAHEIDSIKDKLKEWQDRKLKTHHFIETLNKLIDELNN